VRSAADRLHDIIEAIERIERHLPISIDELKVSDERQVWFVHHLRIIGEAARGLTDEVRAEMPPVPWRQWVGMRQILVHEYFAVDVDAVFEAVTNDIETLKNSVLEWLKHHGS
jgi:uncharacterized protein with HEPN domain